MGRCNPDSVLSNLSVVSDNWPWWSPPWGLLLFQVQWIRVESVAELQAREEELAREWQWLVDVLNTIARTRAERAELEAFRLLQGQCVAEGHRTRGAQLVGEVVQYKNAYRLCYIRGPEGLLIGLAQELS